MKLYNLIHENQNYVSSICPDNLPENNYCYIEIEYTDKIIKSIKGIYKNNDVKECILSGLDVTVYINKLNIFLDKEGIDKDKIYLNFIEEIENENERINKIFIILLSSYLIYFNFLQFPYNISLELLNNEKFKYVTSFIPVNEIEKIFIEHVSLLHRYFSEIFDSRSEILDKTFIEMIDEIKEYKKRLFLDIDKKILIFEKNFEEIQIIKKKFTEIFKNF